MKWSSALALLLAGCGSLPRDTDATLKHVQARHRVRVGTVLSPTAGGAAAGKLVRAISAASGAEPAVVGGDAETMLAALDRDEVDVVIAPFAADTPWKQEVTLAPPVAEVAGGEVPIYLRAAVRNGENRWAMLVEHASRATTPELAEKG